MHAARDEIGSTFLKNALVLLTLPLQFNLGDTGRGLRSAMPSAISAVFAASSAVLAVMLHGMQNDIYFTVGLVTIIGLSARNAILIIEFAQDLRAEGHALCDAPVTAARLRSRPILKTSSAFMPGVMPLAFATGAHSASQRAIGTDVLGGMISTTVLAVLFVPTFFVIISKLFNRRVKMAPADGGLRPRMTG